MILKMEKYIIIIIHANRTEYRTPYHYYHYSTYWPKIVGFFSCQGNKTSVKPVQPNIIRIIWLQWPATVARRARHTCGFDRLKSKWIAMKTYLLNLIGIDRYLFPRYICASSHLTTIWFKRNIVWVRARASAYQMEFWTAKMASTSTNRNRWRVKNNNNWSGMPKKLTLQSAKMYEKYKKEKRRCNEWTNKGKIMMR